MEDTFREWGFKWIHGLILVVLMLLVNTAFTVLGLTLTIGSFQTAITSLASLGFVTVTFLLLPIIYGIISGGLSSLLGEGDGDFSLPDDKAEWVLTWIHGLVLVILMTFVTAVSAVFGLGLNFTVLTALTSFGALVMGLLGFVVLPIVFGWISEGLTTLLHEG